MNFKLKINNIGELKSRQREWVSFLIRHYNAGDIAVTANNLYDVEYVKYFTGIAPEYIPSWCGDLDGSYGGKTEWIGCEIENKIYNPTIGKALIVPYKQTLWAGGQEIDETNSLYVEMSQAKQRFTAKYGNITNSIVHSNHEIGRYIPN